MQLKQILLSLAVLLTFSFSVAFSGEQKTEPKFAPLLRELMKLQSEIKTLKSQAQETADKEEAVKIEKSISLTMKRAMLIPVLNKDTLLQSLGLEKPSLVSSGISEERLSEAIELRSETWKLVNDIAKNQLNDYYELDNFLKHNDVSSSLLERHFYIVKSIVEKKKSELEWVFGTSSDTLNCINRYKQFIERTGLYAYTINGSTYWWETKTFEKKYGASGPSSILNKNVLRKISKDLDEMWQLTLENDRICTPVELSKFVMDENIKIKKDLGEYPFGK